MRVGFAALVTLLITFGLGELYFTAVERELPLCQVEDGSDIDGQCLWIDPDTGQGYINPTPEEVRK